MLIIESDQTTILLSTRYVNTLSDLADSCSKEPQNHSAGDNSLQLFNLVSDHPRARSSRVLTDRTATLLITTYLCYTARIHGVCVLKPRSMKQLSIALINTVHLVRVMRQALVGDERVTHFLRHFRLGG